MFTTCPGSRDPIGFSFISGEYEGFRNKFRSVVLGSKEQTGAPQAEARTERQRGKRFFGHTSACRFNRKPTVADRISLLAAPLLRCVHCVSVVMIRAQRFVST
jgi:hypothetical protein